MDPFATTCTTSGGASTPLQYNTRLQDETDGRDPRDPRGLLGAARSRGESRHWTGESHRHSEGDRRLEAGKTDARDPRGLLDAARPKGVSRRRWEGDHRLMVG